MNIAFYFKLARTGMKKNGRLYLPYLLTCMGMVAMCYIISFLSVSETLKMMRGGDTMQVFMSMGFGVMCFFSAIFLYYTNSFLMRRRKKEFGLYNILGMGKRNIALLLLCEGLTSAAVSIIGGLFFGILFSKFAELGMLKIMGAGADFSFSVGLIPICKTISLFAVIFALIYLDAVRQTSLTDPIGLLRSESAGEKPPKANWLAALLGAGLLGGAYYMSLTIEDPVAAIFIFFVSLLMVIAATYLLFMAGSVTMCRLLQKNKRYYYRTNHFVSISSMAFRMKRNGAGLASICILCTMVLVMISSTACLYLGFEDSLRRRYPRNIGVDFFTENVGELSDQSTEKLREIILEVCRDHDESPQDTLNYRAAAFAGFLGNGRVLPVPSDDMDYELFRQAQIYIIPLSDYNRLMGKSETLGDGEAIICSTNEMAYDEAYVSLGQIKLDVVKKADRFIADGDDAMQIIPSFYIFVGDFERVVSDIMAQGEGWDGSYLKWMYGFDLDCQPQKQIEIYKDMVQRLKAESSLVSIESAANERDSFYALYGGLFFLGILLGITFVFAAVLIIYYKQVSEGYEDRSRFDIMRKVGMSRKDIKKSVNSQVLTVFFLPILTAGIHLAFAFPIVRKLLLIFSLTDTVLLVKVTLACYIAFALFYIVIYRLTSYSYFSVVSKTDTSV